ncbi:MAG: VWA domain-containing protein, partial [Quisquiliibacterium sp.]
SLGAAAQNAGQRQVAPIEHDAEFAPSANRRLAHALAALHGLEQSAATLERREAAPSASAQEALRQADFDAMSVNEWREAHRLLMRWQLHLPKVQTRRLRSSTRGHRPDWRRIATDAARRAGDIVRIARQQPGVRTTPLVALIDISGSMSRYSRMFLMFLHALASAERSTQVFLFGTRLTSVTRALRMRDPDMALRACAQLVPDWSGGTRIGESLHRFNLEWSRRVLGQNATVLLVTDGLERGNAKDLSFEAERLSKSCHRLIWLNPLLRYRGFEPRAAGVRAILPHVDAHLPVHNLNSLDDLSRALGALGRHPRNALTSL